jgi:hypothetical protein
MFFLVRMIVNGFRWLFGGRQRKARLEQAGVNAPAEIVSIRDTGASVNDNPRVALTVRVNPRDGSTPFELSAKRLVSRVAIPRVGDSVTVRYDPEDHTNCAIGATG